MPPAHKSASHARIPASTKCRPASAKRSAPFILTCGARRARDQVRFHNSMLVHVTRYTAVQRQVRAEVEAEVKNIRNRMRVGGGRESWTT